MHSSLYVFLAALERGVVGHNWWMQAQMSQSKAHTKACNRCANPQEDIMLMSHFGKPRTHFYDGVVPARDDNDEIKRQAYYKAW